MDLGVTMSLDAFELTKELGMGRIRPGEHLQLTIELGYSFILRPESVQNVQVRGEVKTRLAYLSRRVANSFSRVASESIADIFFEAVVAQRHISKET